MKFNESANNNIKFWRDVLKGTCKAKKLLESLPQAIQELEAQNIACTFIWDTHYQISIWPEKIDDLALRFQWVHQTMLLFKNELNAIWDEKPDVEDKNSLKYTGQFKVDNSTFEIFIHSCPPAPNCKIKTVKSSYEVNSYEIECPEEVAV
jgi:hypothetical protein